MRHVNHSPLGVLTITVNPSHNRLSSTPRPVAYSPRASTLRALTACWNCKRALRAGTRLEPLSLFRTRVAVSLNQKSIQNWVSQVNCYHPKPLASEFIRPDGGGGINQKVNGWQVSAAQKSVPPARKPSPHLHLCWRRARESFRPFPQA